MKKPYTDQEKYLVEYLKKKMKDRGVQKFPRDWHLKQLSVARTMLDGNAPPLTEYIALIDQLFVDPYWQDKIDHLARVFALYPKYKLQRKRRITHVSGNAPDSPALVKPGAPVPF